MYMYKYIQYGNTLLNVFASGNMFRLGNIESYNMGDIGNIGSIGK